MYYARGSLFETKYWINRSVARKLLTLEQGNNYAEQLSDIARQLNRFVKGLKQQKQSAGKIREPQVPYFVEDENILFSESDIQWLNMDHDEADFQAQSPISSLESQKDFL